MQLVRIIQTNTFSWKAWTESKTLISTFEQTIKRKNQIAKTTAEIASNFVQEQLRKICTSGNLVFQRIKAKVTFSALLCEQM